MTCAACAAKDREIAVLRQLAEGAWRRVGWTVPRELDTAPLPFDLYAPSAVEARAVLALRLVAGQPDGARGQDICYTLGATVKQYSETMRRLRKNGLIELRAGFRWFVTPAGDAYWRAACQFR